MVCDHSKQSFSVMFCGDAAGHFLPPMVVYKAKNVYENWTKGGPTGKMILIFISLNNICILLFVLNVL